MANYNTLISAIQSVIAENGNNEITGNILQQTLVAMIGALGGGYQFGGIATPETIPGTPDEKIFYLGSSGTYPNFGPAVIPSGNMGVFFYDSSWHVGTIPFPIGDGTITTQKLEDRAVTEIKLSIALLDKLFSIGYKYIDIATPSTNPGIPTQNVMYVASTPGTYTNFGGLVVNDGEVCFLCYNGSWTKKISGAATAVQVGVIGQELNEINSRLFGGEIPSQTEENITNNFVWVNSRFIAATNPESDPLLTIGVIYQSGSAASRANNAYVDISAYSKLRISLAYMANANLAPGLCFYDSNHNVVESVWRADRTPISMTVETINVPVDAKYVRTTWRSDYGDFSCIGIKDSSFAVGGVVSPFIESPQITENITEEFVWTQSKYRSQLNGALASSSSTSSYGSNLVDVRNFDKLQIYVPELNLSQTNAGWAWYDNNQEFIIGNALIGPSTTMRQVILNRPKNAVYFATTKRTDGVDNTFICVGIINERKDSQEVADWAKDQLNETANVRFFGAVGDGVVDDTTAVLLAVASGAKRIYFPAGTYLVGKTINLVSGVELYGDGMGISVLKFLGASNSVQPGGSNYDIHYWRTNQVKTLIHTIAGGSNHYIHDIEIDASDFVNDNMRYIALSICTANDSRIERVYIHHLNYDPTRDPSVQMEYGFQFFIWANSTRVVVDQCRGDYAGYENIGTEDVTDVTISNSYFGYGWRTSLQLHRGTRRTRIIGNTINNQNLTTAHASFTIHGITTNYIDDIIISGNLIRSQTNENQGNRGGVAFVQSGFKNIIFEGNNFEGNSYCIVDLLTDGESTTWPINVVITDNILRNTRYGVKLLRGNNYIIKDNIIDSANVAIDIKVNNYIVKDNILPNNTTKNLAGTPWQD